MAYATPLELKEYALTQLHETVREDPALQHYLDVSTAIIDAQLGYSFGANAPGTAIVYGSGTPYLKLPGTYVGSITGVTAPSGYTVPTYAVRDGYLVTSDSSGVLYEAAFPSLGYPTWLYYNVWTKNMPYTIAATYGYGDAPADIKQLCIEVAVMVRKYAALGGADVVATEAAAVSVRSQLNPLQTGILAAHAAAIDVGVW